VLFSEPKIPQAMTERAARQELDGFSALQRAENSSNFSENPANFPLDNVSVLFSEPKIPQDPSPRPGGASQKRVSVLFSEPKIPQSWPGQPQIAETISFQCSSASRKFLKRA